MKEARPGGIDGSLDPIREEAMNRLQRALALLGELAAEAAGGLVAHRVAAGWTVIEVGDIPLGRGSDLGKQAAQALTLQKRVGHVALKPTANPARV